MMIGLYLIDSDVFKVNALISPICHPELSTVPAQFPNKWIFLQYCLIKDVVSSLKKHRMHDQQFTHHPLLVLNNFGSEGMQVKLMATMFQHMFPSINVHKVGSFIPSQVILTI